ncbi:unnamed protein product [Echinostoma caproni]|uniref:CCAAT-binding factor domain-containing protein n=1 Tax=Echinostoma caproni TaxID=27848 RepID=A0A3P8FNR2_9TREM|nr:unnamed protein product [Echinostoma caproni]
MVHTTSFNVSLQALTVLFQLCSHRPEIRDRYYQTSRGPTVLHLIYRSMLSDPDADRRAAFAQRLLQLCLAHPQPGFVVGSLILLSKVQVAKQNLIIGSQIPVSTNDSQIVSSAGHSNLTEMVSAGDYEEEEEEHFSDAPDSEVELDALSTHIPTSKTAATWEHRRLMESGKSGGKQTKISASQKRMKFGGYDPEAREPLFARAGGYPTWPLVLLCNHAHPSVSLLAKTLLAGDVVSYTGNPFDDFSMLHFLDRFAYKKPKSSKSKATPNANQKHSTFSHFTAS